MTSSTVGSVHLFELVHAILILEHINFSETPLVSRSDNEVEVFAAHSEDVSAKIPLEQVKANFNIKPYSEVDCCHPYGPRNKRPHALEDHLISPEIKDEANARHGEEETQVADLAGLVPIQ